MKDESKLQLCRGCQADYYNEPGNSTIGRCWLLDNAKRVTRYRIHWWTAPTVPGAYQKVETLDCHSEPGKYAFHKELPDCITAEERDHIEGRVAT